MTDKFPADYSSARHRFHAAVRRLEGWEFESHAIGLPGPDGAPLTLDVACSGVACSEGMHAERMLVLSSGVHGIEGYLGSAVQVALLDKWARDGRFRPPIRCVLLHAVNPYGFAWRRRTAEDNVDLNRNFLLPEEHYRGSPDMYARLDGLLNPRRAPSRWEPFMLKASWAIVRFGMPALRQAVAGGQYDFPQGLFFGGAGPAAAHRILADNMDRWLEGSRRVMHLDFHTGLGRWGEGTLLLDSPLSDIQRERLTRWFGDGSFQTADTSSIAYQVRGGLGRWCNRRYRDRDYLCAYAEYGTYGPVKILAGLRAENQAHHWGDRNSDSTKVLLKELFCPAAESWREKVLGHAEDVVERAIRGLAE